MSWDHKTIERKHIATNNGGGITAGLSSVFFTDLGNAYPPYLYGNLLSQGMEYVNQAAAALQPFDIETSSDFSKMNAYVNFIQELATNESTMEVQLLRMIQAKINNGKITVNEKLKELLDSFLASFKTDQPIDYNNFLTLFNNLFKEQSNLLKVREEIIENNAKLIKTHLDELKKDDAKKDLVDEIERIFFEEDYNNFQQAAKAHLIDTIMQKGSDKIEVEWNNPIGSQIATKINSALYNLPKQNGFIDMISNLLIATKGDEELAADVIKNAAIETVLNSSSQELEQTSGEAYSFKIINHFSTREIKGIVDSYVKSINTTDIVSNLFTGRAIKTLQERALKTSHGLARFFEELDSTDKQELLDESPELKEAYQVLQAEKIKLQQPNPKTTIGKVNALKAKVSKILKQMVEQEAKQLFDAETLNKLQENLSPKERRDIINSMKAQSKEFFKSKMISNALHGALNVKVSSGAIGELLGARGASQVADFTKIFGGSDFKSDIHIIFYWGDLNLKNKKAQKSIYQLSKNSYEDFLSRAEAKNKEKNLKLKTTDVESMIDAYNETIQNIEKSLETLRKQRKISQAELEKIYNFLNNSIFGNITVKDYNFYADDLGVHGGSLGAGSRAQNVIKNINTLYVKAGGLESMDEGLMYFVAINSNSEALASDLKTTLEDYLVAGAVMVMFDEGFTAANHFFQQATTKLQLRGVHLFNVNGKTVPASYIYTQIANNLRVAIGQIESTMTMPNIAKVTISGAPGTNAIPNPQTMPSPQQRWDSVAATAASTSIKLSFLGHLLEIFNKIPQAFNNVG